MVDVPVIMPEVDFGFEDLPNLHELLDKLREQGPVSPINFTGETIWLLNDYATVKSVIADDEYLAAPPAYETVLGLAMGKVIATMTGAQHRLNRAVVANVFFPKKMRELADTMFIDEARLMVESLASQDRVELVSEYNRRYTFNNITRLLGLPRADVSILEDWSDRMMHSYLDLDAAIAAGVEMGEYLLPIVTERRKESVNDVISLLTQAKVDGEGISDDEILAFCRNLFPAAIDTSTNSLGSLEFQLLKTPDLLPLLSGETKTIDAVLDEMLRLEPPLVMLPRKCVKQVELGGYTIEEGDDVRICLTGANLDASHFEKPYEFNLDRNVKNLTFGHGEHFCLGTHMARRVIEIGLVTLMERFPNMMLCEDKAVDIVGGVLRGPRELWVELNTQICLAP